MYIASFWEILGTSLALILLGSFITGLVYCGKYIWEKGYEQRVKLEKRGNLYDSVEDYKQLEDKELETLRKRKKELGKGEQEVACD